MDETGYAMGLAFAAKVVILRGRIINFKTIDGNREWVTQIDSIGMHGQIIPPFIIFKGKQHTDSLWETAEEAIGECSIGMTENGWSNEEMGLKWLQHFERHTRRTEAWEASKIDTLDVKHHGYRLLIMDGHRSYTNIEFIEFCWKHKIIPICLPPHSTHFLQPLDLVIFSVVKRLYSAKVDEYAARGITGINRDYFLQILGEIRPQIYTPELINNAFKAAGLLPFNPDRVLQRLTGQPSSARLCTPQPSNEPTLLSSPLHPKTPKSHSDRARYSHTIRHSDTTSEAIDVVVKKLISHMDSMDEGIEILRLENTELRNGAADRRAKKKNKRVVLSTESVLTTESAKALIDAREAANEAKQRAKNTREQLRKERNEVAIIAKAQVQERKVARAAATKAKRVADQHKKDLGEADRAAKRAQKASVTTGNIAKRKKTAEACMSAVQAVEEAKSKAEALAMLQKQWEDSFAVAIEAIARSKALQDAAKKAKEASQQATQADEEVDDELSGSSNDEVSDMDEDINMGDVMALIE